MQNGDIQPASGIFNQRAQVRRCAVLQRESGWTDDKNWVHMTNTALAPVLSFAGMNYDWEDTYGDMAIQERYSRECILAQSIGRQFGNQVAVMGYFATKDPKSEKLTWLHRGHWRVSGVRAAVGSREGVARGACPARRMGLQAADNARVELLGRGRSVPGRRLRCRNRIARNGQEDGA